MANPRTPPSARPTPPSCYSPSPPPYCLPSPCLPPPIDKNSTTPPYLTSEATPTPITVQPNWPPIPALPTTRASASSARPASATRRRLDQGLGAPPPTDRRRPTAPSHQRQPSQKSTFPILSDSTRTASSPRAHLPCSKAVSAPVLEFQAPSVFTTSASISSKADRYMVSDREKPASPTSGDTIQKYCAPEDDSLSSRRDGTLRFEQTNYEAQSVQPLGHSRQGKDQHQAQQQVITDEILDQITRLSETITCAAASMDKAYNRYIATVQTQSVTYYAATVDKTQNPALVLKPASWALRVDVVAPKVFEEKPTQHSVTGECTIYPTPSTEVVVGTQEGQTNEDNQAIGDLWKINDSGDVLKYTFGQKQQNDEKESAHDPVEMRMPMQELLAYEEEQKFVQKSNGTPSDHYCEHHTLIPQTCVSATFSEQTLARIPQSYGFSDIHHRSITLADETEHLYHEFPADSSLEQIVPNKLFSNLHQQMVVQSDGTQHSYLALPENCPLAPATTEPHSEVSIDENTSCSNDSVHVCTGPSEQQTKEVEQRRIWQSTKCVSNPTFSLERPKIGTDGVFILKSYSKAPETEKKSACVTILSDWQDFSLDLQPHEDGRPLDVVVRLTNQPTPVDKFFAVCANKLIYEAFRDNSTTIRVPLPYVGESVEYSISNGKIELPSWNDSESGCVNVQRHKYTRTNGTCC